jgi:hypothetical protein
LLVLLSMAAWAAEAQTAPGPPFVRRVPLVESRGGAARAGHSRNAHFDAEINPRKCGWMLSARVKFWHRGALVTLLAEGDLGEGVTLRVPFLTEPPRGAAFQLVTDSDVADSQVMVYRSANAPELMQAG